MLLALLDVVVEDVPEVVPAALRDQDGVAEVAFDLGHGDVSKHILCRLTDLTVANALVIGENKWTIEAHLPALRVLLAGEEEVLVLDADVPVVGGRCRFLDLTVVVLLDELLLKHSHMTSGLVFNSIVNDSRLLKAHVANF